MDVGGVPVSRKAHEAQTVLQASRDGNRDSELAGTTETSRRMIMSHGEAFLILGVVAFMPFPASSQSTPQLANALVVPGNADHVGTRSSLKVGGVRGFQDLGRFDPTTLRAGTTSASESAATQRLFCE